MNFGFNSEAELFKEVEKSNVLHDLHLYSGWQVWAESEVEGFFGRPDYLIGYCRTDSLGRKQVRSVAFELKLTNWKKALIQAFRYASFANYAYVLMDHCFVERALRSIDQFLKSNIGLLSFSKTEGLVIHHRPTLQTPYTPSLRTKLYERICTELV